jgi:enoyl-CoA hydratase
METLRLEVRDGIGWLRLDKPRGNAIDEALVEELASAANALERDDAVRVVVLGSAHPKLFCPGLDLVGLVELDRPGMERFMTRFGAAVTALYALRKPVVAAVSGAAVAGGCILALTADYRVLRQGAPIGLNEVKVGVPLPWGVAMLLRASVPAPSLARVALLGRNFADAEALAIGLADEVAEAGALDAAVQRVAGEFAEKDPASLAATKSWLRAGALAEMRARDRELIGIWLDAWFSPETRERIRATVASLKR